MFQFCRLVKHKPQGRLKNKISIADYRGLAEVNEDDGKSEERMGLR